MRHCDCRYRRRRCYEIREGTPGLCDMQLWYITSNIVSQQYKRGRYHMRHAIADPRHAISAVGLEIRSTIQIKSAIGDWRSLIAGLMWLQLRYAVRAGRDGDYKPNYIIFEVQEFRFSVLSRVFGILAIRWCDSDIATNGGPNRVIGAI